MLNGESLDRIIEKVILEHIVMNTRLEQKKAGMVFLEKLLYMIVFIKRISDHLARNGVPGI